MRQRSPRRRPPRSRNVACCSPNLTGRNPPPMNSSRSAGSRPPSGPSAIVTGAVIGTPMIGSPSIARSKACSERSSRDRAPIVASGKMSGSQPPPTLSQRRRSCARALSPWKSSHRRVANAPRSPPHHRAPARRRRAPSLSRPARACGPCRRPGRAGGSARDAGCRSSRSHRRVPSCATPLRAVPTAAFPAPSRSATAFADSNPGDADVVRGVLAQRYGSAGDERIAGEKRRYRGARSVRSTRLPPCLHARSSTRRRRERVDHCVSFFHRMPARIACPPLPSDSGWSGRS